jgi:hypothetical protein
MQEIDIPKTKPAAPRTWELRAELDADTEESAQVSLDFPGPYLIIGAYASVAIRTNTANLVTPTIDDILVLLELNNQDRFTSGREDDNGSPQYVTLASLDTRFRDLHICADSPKPVLTATFRWKIGAAADGIFQDADIALAFISGPLKELNRSR